MIYGQADSRRFPMICLEMSKPANCCREDYNQSDAGQFFAFDLSHLFQLFLVSQIKCNVE